MYVVSRKKLNKGKEFVSTISWKPHKTSKSLVVGGTGIEDSSGPCIAQADVSLSDVCTINYAKKSIAWSLMLTLTKISRSKPKRA